MAECFLCMHPDSSVVCSGCSATFCTKQHLGLHTSKEGICLPYNIMHSGEFGRYLVASKDIDAGELVLSEECVVWGPNHVGDLLCLECLQPVDQESFCVNCGYPLCKDHLQCHPFHQDECDLFHEQKFSISPTIRENDIESAYPLIAPLRCLRLKNKDPVSWRMVSNLMDHREERESEKELYIEPYRHDVITKIVHDLQASTEQETVDVLGFLDVNSIAVRGRDGVYRGRGIYPVASLMNHSCVCNTRNIIDGTRLETYATVPIKCGDLITTHYVSPLLPVNIRREKLRERWFFDCGCERCASSSDLSAFTSALGCSNCQGTLLPSNPLDYNTEYRCQECGHTETCDYASKLVSSLNPLVQALQVFQLPDTREEENLVKQLEQNLHKHHHLVLELKLNLARKLGRTSGKLEKAENEVLMKKIELSTETLGVMNIIYPGLSKYRGLLCFELAESLVTLSARLVEGSADPISTLVDIIRTTKDDADQMVVDGDPFTQHIKACEAVILEGLKCLVLDRPGSYENEVYEKLKWMRTACSDLLQFRQFL